MDVVQFNSVIIGEPSGLRNPTKNHCYWNSTAQALLTCSSLLEVFNEVAPDQRDTFIEKFHMFADKKIDHIELYKCYVTSLYRIGKKSDDLRQMISQQQCVSETLGYILEIFENNKKIINLFQHRYLQSLVCLECHHVSNNRFMGMVFEITPTTNLQATLSENIEPIDDYKCERCESKKRKMRKTQLTMVPEILPIVVKQYDWLDGVGVKKDLASDFPEFITFSNGFRYRAVAYINHFGRLNYGHYTATTLRKSEDGTLKWFIMNDEVVMPTQYGPDANTYMVYYHYDGLEAHQAHPAN